MTPAMGASGSPPSTTGSLPEKTSSTIQDMQKELFSEKPLEKPITKEVTVMRPSDMTITSTTPPPPVSAENQQIRDIKEQTTEAMEALARLNQQMASNITQIKSLDAHTRDVSQTVAKLNADISAMDNRLLAVTNSANSLSKDINSLRNEVGNVKKSLKEEERETLSVSTAVSAVHRRAEPPMVLVEEPEYVVHAVIPGRAWIKSSKGQIVTVSEGDSLGNYGKVVVIDATNGVVLTSSGVAFR